MADDAQYAHDPKFRQFSSSVEKALRSFESTSEWADLISALGKLGKVLQSHVQFPIVPKKYTVGKRLSQCTHPALPSGCHLKALEVYDLIFTRIGSSGLARDIFVYASGLFPLLGCAAMSVRRPLLSIYETHFLPLGHHLSPALQGLLLALLPGLEEGSEHLPRIQQLLVSLCKCTDQWLFYNALWSCVLSVPSARMPALMFVLSQVSKGTAPEDQQHFFGDDLSTMITGLSAALADGVVLVQRSALDVLVSLLPLHQEFLLRSDTVAILRSALSCLLRRDMSLSRRLYSWLLGYQGKSTESVSRKKEYFHRYSKPLVVQAVRSMLLDSATEDVRKSSWDTQSGRMEVVRPIRILVTLLDKEDIGPLIIDEILLDVVRSLYTVGRPFHDAVPNSADRNTSNATSSRLPAHAHQHLKGLDEVRLQAQTLFEQLNPSLVWQHFADCFIRLECTCPGSLELGRPPLRRSTSASSRSRLSSTDMTEARSGKEESKSGCTFEELVDLTTFMLGFMPLELTLDLKGGILQVVFCHCLRALRQHCELIPFSTIHSAVTLCAQLLARSPAATSPTYPPGTLWPDLPTVVAPSLSPKYLEGFPVIGKDTAMDTDPDAAEDADPGAAEVTDPEPAECTKLQLIEVCQQYVQSFFVKLVKRCFTHCQSHQSHAAGRGGGSAAELPEFKSIVQQAVSAASRLVADAGLSAAAADSDEKEALGQAFASSCRLLVQLSSCQMSMSCDANQRPGLVDRSALSPWLHSLIACTVASPSFDVAASAVRCLLQLCEASQAAPSHTDSIRPSRLSSGSVEELSSESDTVQSGDEPSHFMVMAKETELTTIQRGSYFEALAVLLWRELGRSSMEQQAHLTEMLCQLNSSSLAPGVLERVICSDFSSSDPNVSLSAHKRFALLWHLSFEDDFATSSPHLDRGKMFLRPLNLMLDGLSSRHSWCRALSHSWLEQVLGARDLHRLLQPLILALLKPNSARVQRVLNCPSPSSEKSSWTYSCLVYVRPHDTAVSIYAMKSLLSIVRAQPQLLVTQAASCQLPPGSLSPGIASLADLLTRHEVSISGGVFESSTGRVAVSRRNYFEVLLTILSWTMLSTFADETSQSAATLEQLELLQVTSVELLTALLRACSTVLQNEQTSSSASYIQTLLQICLFHRSYLTCLAKSMVPTIQKQGSCPEEEGGGMAISASQKAFQLLLLELAEVVIELEGRCDAIVGKETAAMCGEEPRPSASLCDCSAAELLSKVQGTTVPLHRLAMQPVFQGAVAYALECYYLASVHCQWINMLNRSVDWLGPALCTLLTTAVSRLSKWLMYLSAIRSLHDASRIEMLLGDVPPLYLPSLLRNWSSLLHYAMLGQKPVELHGTRVSPSTSATAISTAALTPSSPTASSWAMILPFTSSTHPQPAKESFQLEDHLHPVREGVFQSLASIVQALVDVWSAWRHSATANLEATHYLPVMWGSAEHVSRQIVSLALPVGFQYPSQFLQAVAEVWLREQKGQPVLLLSTPAMMAALNGKQEQVMSLICELPCLSCEVLFSVGRRLLVAKEFTAPQEECFFHLLVHRVARASSQDLQKCWPLLQALMKDGLGAFASNPPRLFLSVILLMEYLRGTPQPEDRKVKREVQDLSQKCLDACTNVVAASLENTAWLRRSMAITASHLTQSDNGDGACGLPASVSSDSLPRTDSPARTSPSHDSPVMSGQDTSSQMPATTAGSVCTEYVVINSESERSSPSAAPAAAAAPGASASVEKTKGEGRISSSDSVPVVGVSKGMKSTKLIAVYSPQALQCLSNVMATFVDVVYGSEDKERAIAILANMMVYVLPFLKTHSSQNVLSSTAAINLLSSVSEFHYTRKAWRREITELFFDPGFFHFDSSQLVSWCSIVDNLLGHDKQARRDLLSRVSITQSGLNLFTNSDVEMQQRAQLLKRLTFAIYSSPLDQYEPLLPDIQERVAECLRIAMAPTVHQQVFYCWRVLLVRLSASHLTAFWPVIMTELTQVLLQLEQDLILDASKWVRRQGATTTVAQQRDDPWLGLYLSACKLLDLVLALPPSSLPQFQMYQWAFVGAQRRRRRIVAENALSVVGPPEFEPYMVRMVDLLDQVGIPESEALQQPTGRPLLSQHSISSLLELKPFILGLVKAHHRTAIAHSACTKPLTDDLSASSYIENLIGQDFLEYTRESAAASQH